MSVEPRRARTDHTSDPIGSRVDEASRDAAAEVVRKIMALSENEFWSGLAALQALRSSTKATSTNVPREVPVRFALDEGCVEVLFEPLAERRLGGLLLLPQARVSLTFQATSSAARAGFLGQFWLVFQRGGG